jgi:DmsE family decaheme c-type cytochrome
MGGRGNLRAGILPAAAFLFLVALLAAACVPAQRAAELPPSMVSAPADAYVGSEVCKNCHEDQFATFSHTKMGRLFLFNPRDTKESRACETCHGPGKAHVEAGGGKGVGGMISFGRKDPTPVEERNAICLSCHERMARLFWQGSPHESRDVACTNCHRVMEDVAPHQLAKATEIETCGQCHIEKRAQQMRTSHMPLREGKMTCTSCHNPHGSATPSLLKENSVNDTCFTCHADKRGPFLWEHAPVTESCVNCHDPHGSNHENMLKMPKPRLCQQCHIETRHPTRPYGKEPVPSNLKFVLGSQCLNCHVNIHGSNHPSGFAFTR